MNQPADYLARQQALDPGRSFAVTAPAGSGKTGLLTQRVLRLLATCDTPEEVLCITFTRKAAAEMQERISTAIADAASQPRPASGHAQLSWDLAQAVLTRDRQLQWNLLSNPNRLRIQTIDGLCAALTRHNPFASLSGGVSGLLDQPQQAYRAAVAATLRLLEADEPLHRDISRLLTHLDNNLTTVTELLVRLLARRDQWMGHLLQIRNARLYLESSLAELITDTLRESTDLIGMHGSSLAALADYAGNQCRLHAPGSPLLALEGMQGLPANDSDALPEWKLLVEFLLTQTDTWRSPKGLNVKVGFPPGNDKAEKAACKARKEAMSELLGYLAEIPGLHSNLTLIRYLPPASYERDQWRLLDSLTHILPRLVAELKLVFRQLNATDFIEVAQSALLAFGDEDSPTELALALDYRIRHILVDEFQDTSSPQLRLLENLTRGWQPGDGRTLFIVGDGMQSCYGFRDANVGIFLDARQRGIGDLQLEPLDLQVNFRSQAGIIDWVNHTFGSAFPERDDIARGAVRYSPSIAFHPPQPGPAVDLHMFVDASDRRAEAQRVCELVQTAQRENPDASIAILVRTRGILRYILPALQAAGLSWQATDIDPLASRMAIVDLLTLTKALSDPGDRIAWLALLRSPWCGLDLTDLQQLAGVREREDQAHFPDLMSAILTASRQRPALSATGHTLLLRFARVISCVWQERRRKSLRQWIQGAWMALGGPATLLDAADKDNTQTYFALLEKHDRGGQIPDWEAFTLAVNKLYAAPDATANPKLQIMTIHKSKGLEFDTVIIPGLDMTGRPDDHELLIWQERIASSGKKQLILSTLAPTGEDKDPVYHYLREEAKLRSRLESTRLIYVGCTRAINKLHLLFNVKSDDKTEGYKPPAKASLLAPMWPALALDQARVELLKTEPVTPSELAVDEDDMTAVAVPALPYSLRLCPSWQRPVLIPSTLLSGYRGHEFEGDENLPILDSLLNRRERQIGIVMHQVLEQIATLGASHWDNGRIKRQTGYWQTLLRAQGLSGNELVQALNIIELAVRKTLSDSTGTWILSAEHPQSACELELYQGSEGHASAIIDRTFVDNGTRWIIDYKSSTPKPDQSTATFFAHEAEIYRPQLQRYARLFTLQGEASIRAGLYFPLLQHFEEISL